MAAVRRPCLTLLTRVPIRRVPPNACVLNRSLQHPT